MDLDKSGWFKWFAIAFGIFLVSGFGLGSFIQLGTQTFMACPCGTNPLVSENEKGNISKGYTEISCNSVDTTDYIFFTGAVNIYRHKEGTEIIECSKGKQVGEHVDYETQGPLKLSVTMLGEYTLS